MGKILRRSEVNEHLTWDLTSLFTSEEELYKDLLDLTRQAKEIQEKYKGRLDESLIIKNCLDEFMQLAETMDKIGTYAQLSLSVDQSNNDAAKLYSKVSSELAKIHAELTFVTNELTQCNDDVLHDVIKHNESLKTFISNVIEEKKFKLHPEVEKTLNALSPVLSVFYPIYNRSKLADLVFDPIKIQGEEHPLSFVRFENELEYSPDHTLRHQAFKQFYDQLSNYQNTMSATYQAQIMKEKILSDMRGYDNVYEFLLFDQKVNKDMLDRQIDVIYKDLAPIMAKYAKLLQDEYKLEKMTFADLKLPLDPDFEPEITIDEAKETIIKGLSVLGEDYLHMINRAFDERWIDFENNLYKSTGAFCSSPYCTHPYILISWSKRMRECFVLAHELGHAGHFYNAHQHQNILSSRSSLYFIEAPSTMNELLVANHLKNNATDLRMKRWVLSSIISRTYYHNFVTHLLEAAYQREVYDIIESGGSVVADTLNQLTLKTLRGFWKENVEIQDYAQYTWMRQPHYYMGLYPYTYSAGLTISTLANQKIFEDPSLIQSYKEVLQAGGTLTPVELAAKLDIDLTNNQALKDTIKIIGDMVDEIIDLTKKINSSQ